MRLYEQEKQLGGLPSFSTVKTTVIDIVTKKPIEGVNLEIMNRHTPSGTSTASDGSFGIEVYSNEMIKITHLNYTPLILYASVLINNSTKVIELVPKVHELDEVIVTVPKKNDYSYKKIGLAVIGLFVLRSFFKSKGKTKRKSKGKTKKVKL